MSHTISELISCSNIQNSLNIAFSKQNFLDKKEPQGFTEFVVSPINTDNFVQRTVAPGRGKKRVVEVIWTPPILEEEIGTSPAKKCVSTNEAGQLSETYELGDDGVNYDELFTLSNLTDACIDNELWFAQRIQAIMDAMVKKIGTINAEQLALLTGKFGVGESGVSNDVKTISTRKADGSYDVDGLAEITYACMNAGYGVTPVVFGFGEIHKYMLKTAAGCCASDGIDISRFFAGNQVIFVPDKKVHTALGSDNSFITLAPGAVQMLQWLEFEGAKGINVIDDDSYKQTVLTDPKTGIRFDFQLKNDCGNISINLKLVHKLIGLPDDLYSVGDPFHGIKWVNEFAISNPQS